MGIMTIELTVHSCKDIKGFNFFQRMEIYAEAWLNLDPNNKQKTATDRENDRNPEWKHRMRFEVEVEPGREAVHPVEAMTVDFEIRKEGGLGLIDKTIGWVSVPLANLLDGYEGGVRHVSYQVRGSNDEAAGFLNFSYSIESEFFRVLNKPYDLVHSEVNQASPAPTVTAAESMTYIPYPTVEAHQLPPPPEPSAPPCIFATPHQLPQTEPSCIFANRHQLPPLESSAPPPCIFATSEHIQSLVPPSMDLHTAIPNCVADRYCQWSSAVPSVPDLAPTPLSYYHGFPPPHRPPFPPPPPLPHPYVQPPLPYSFPNRPGHFPPPHPGWWY